MGFAAGGGKGKVKSDINITPLVDVVLVLLIIFLVTMPILLRQITLEIPRKLDSQDVLEVDVPKQITISIKNNGNVVLNDGVKDTDITVVDLPKTLRPMLDKRTTEKVVFIDIEDRVAYRDTVELMDAIKGSGADTVALKIKEEPQPGAPAAPAAPAAPTPQ